ncbi:hypothetical protein, partial [Flavobacterium sp.]|uniref:hypothetical protein n=1 Tax=Flavobacterium sp. TaxID=239 RepID=UPI0026038B60
IQRAIWQAGLTSESFSKMSSSSENWVLLFIILGTILMFSMASFFIYLLIQSWKKSKLNIEE